MKDIIYFDNAATSWPKPSCVIAAMQDFLQNVGANPGRSGHRLSVEASRIVFDARENISRLFGIKDSSRVIFTLNATYALNIAIKGILQDGDHVITSSMEHNSVMRPLNYHERKNNVTVTKIKNDLSGVIDVNALESSINPNTKLVVLTHGSNVNGIINPIKQIGSICRKRGVLFLLDSAQTAGCVSIDVERDNIDMLAFTGHKGLMGPQGTGGLFCREGIDLESLFHGGSGSKSESHIHPDFFPDKLEAGTLNTVGIAGLSQSIQYIQKEEINAIFDKEEKLAQCLIQGLKTINNVILYCPEKVERRLPIVSFNVQGLQPSNIGLSLDKDFKIMSRVGLQCAPSAHKEMGTYPQGTVRLSMNYFNTKEQIEKVIMAIRAIAKEK